MDYREAILMRRGDPRALEALYRGLTRTDARDFQRALVKLHAERPQDPVLAAWHYRLLPEERGADAARRWGVAVA
ncbi:MAG: hypothetical protein ACP5G7_06945, partial [Anaerolineae bacterium]